MFDIGPAELIVLVVAAVLLFGPEKLPDLARKAARVIAYVRNIANNAQSQISTELGPGFEDFDIRDPKGSIRRHIMDQVEPLVADVQAEIEESKKTFAETTDDLKSVRDDITEAATLKPDGDVEAVEEVTDQVAGGEDEGAQDVGADDGDAEDVGADGDAEDEGAEHDRPHPAAAEPAMAGAPFDPDAT